MKITKLDPGKPIQHKLSQCDPRWARRAQGLCEQRGAGLRGSAVGPLWGTRGPLGCSSVAPGGPEERGPGECRREAATRRTANIESHCPAL